MLPTWPPETVNVYSNRRNSKFPAHSIPDGLFLAPGWSVVAHFSLTNLEKATAQKGVELSAI